MRLDEPVVRLATPDDEAAVAALMKESAAALFPRFYDEQQAASAVRHIAQVDPMLLADGTYFTLESRGQLVACGGWSRRDKLYTGSGDSERDARPLDPSSEPARVHESELPEALASRRDLALLENAAPQIPPGPVRAEAYRCISLTGFVRSGRSKSLCPTGS